MGIRSTFLIFQSGAANAPGRQTRLSISSPAFIRRIANLRLLACVFWPTSRLFLNLLPSFLRTVIHRYFPESNFFPIGPKICASKRTVYQLPSIHFLLFIHFRRSKTSSPEPEIQADAVTSTWLQFVLASPIGTAEIPSRFPPIEEFFLNSRSLGKIRNFSANKDSVLEHLLGLLLKVYDAQSVFSETNSGGKTTFAQYETSFPVFLMLRKRS
jgi:hypothetical protein